MAEMTAWPHQPLAAPGVFTTRKNISIRIERLLRTGRAIGSSISPATGAAVAIGLLAGFYFARHSRRPSHLRCRSAGRGEGAAVGQTVHDQTVPGDGTEPTVTLPQVKLTIPSISVSVPKVAVQSVHVAVAKPVQVAQIDDAHGLNCSGCDFSRQQLAGKNLSHANLSGSNFRSSNLQGANFDHSNLGGVDFGGADLRNAIFTHANLSGADLRGARLDGARFDDADLNGSDIDVRTTRADTGASVSGALRRL